MLTDIEKLRAGALDKAADAIWKWLDPNDEIGRVGIIPNRFNEAAQAAISAHNAFIREAVDDAANVEAMAKASCEGYFEHNILDRRGYTRKEFIEKFWKGHVPQVQAANQVNVYRAIVCGET